jgi:membrane-bound metal-dependent hydrolase YbcI (DUF457 family)
MGRQHCLTGVLAGVGVAACIPGAPIGWRLLVIAVTGGASLLPDLDHPSATAARSLGFVTRLLAKGVDAASLAIYHATREGADPTERHSGHRLFTHTVPGAALASRLAASLCLLHPLAGAALCALLAGLMSLGLKFAGSVFAAASGFTGWWLLERENGWWWLVPVSVFVGCVVHILGDTVTNSGTPLLWPLRTQGRRWRLVTTPATFAAGDSVELYLVAPLLMFGCFLAAGGLMGVWPVVWVAVTRGGA